MNTMSRGNKIPAGPYNFNLNLNNVVHKKDKKDIEDLNLDEDLKLTPAKKRFIKKLKEEMFEEFTSGDWIMYFQRQYLKVNKKPLIIGFYPKYHAIFKKLMKTQTTLEIRNMVDFIFQSDQDLVDKDLATPSILSGNWINTMLVCSSKWVQGKYKPKSKTITKRPNREWTGSAENKNSVHLSNSISL